MELKVTGDLPASLIEQIRQNLSPLLPIVLDRKTLLQKSHLPPQVRLIGDRTEWIETLRRPASTFLALLSAEGDSTRSSERARIAKALSDENVKPLNKFAQTLCSIRAGEKERGLYIGVGLAIPEWHHSTTMRVLNSDEESVALALARFVNELPAVEKAIREEIRGPNKPYGQVQLEITKNGPIFLRWLDEKDLNYHEREVTPQKHSADQGGGEI